MLLPPGMKIDLPPHLQGVLQDFIERAGMAVSPQQILVDAADLIGAGLAADRAGLAEFDGDGDGFTIRYDWTGAGMASLAGRHSMRDWQPGLPATLRQGTPIIVRDALASGQDAAPAAPFALHEERAGIAVPLIKSGRLAAALYVHQRAARAWTGAELRLASAMAELTWTAVERARGDAASRDLDLAFRGIFNSNLHAMALLALDGTVLDMNRAALRATGATPGMVIGRPIWATAWWPGTASDGAAARLEAAVATAATGTPVRYHEHVSAPGGRLVTMLVTIRPARDAAGRITHLVPESYDMTGQPLQLPEQIKDEAWQRTFAHAAAPTQPHPEGTPARRRADTPDAALHGNATILLCDGDDTHRFTTAQFLRAAGYAVLEADTADAALALGGALRAVDLVLTDIELPGAYGWMLSLQLRATFPSLPVIITGQAGPLSGLTAEAVLIKPVTIPMLSDAVLQQLGRKPMRKTTQAGFPRPIQTLAIRLLYLQWQAARRQPGAVPFLSDIHPEPFGLSPYSFTVAVEPGDPPRFRYVSAGDALNRRLVHMLGGAPLGDTGQERDLFGNLVAIYQNCVRTGGPVYQAARYDFGDGYPVRMERLLLPVTESSGVIDHLIGVVYFSEPAA